MTVNTVEDNKSGFGLGQASWAWRELFLIVLVLSSDIFSLFHDTESDSSGIGNRFLDFRSDDWELGCQRVLHFPGAWWSRRSPRIWPISAPGCLATRAPSTSTAPSPSSGQLLRHHHQAFTLFSFIHFIQFTHFHFHFQIHSFFRKIIFVYSIESCLFWRIFSKDIFTSNVNNSYM